MNTVISIGNIRVKPANRVVNKTKNEIRNVIYKVLRNNTNLKNEILKFSLRQFLNKIF